MFVIYDHPSDYPSCYVLRRWDLRVDGTRSEGGYFAAATDLEIIRALVPSGLHRLARHPDDDPVILETWV